MGRTGRLGGGGGRELVWGRAGKTSALMLPKSETTKDSCAHAPSSMDSGHECRAAGKCPGRGTAGARPLRYRNAAVLAFKPMRCRDTIDVACCRLNCVEILNPGALELGLLHVIS